MKTSLSSPLARGARLTFAILFFAVSLYSLSAQTTSTGTPSPGGSPSGSEPTNYKVGTVTVRFVGTANVSEQVVRANMQVHEGVELDDTMIDRDIRSLYRTGLFEFIEVKREVLPDHGVNLVVEVTPKFRVLAVRYEGNKKVKTHRLEKEAKTRANTSLDERQVKEDAEKLKEYYQKSGYNQISINYSIERDRNTGFGTVIFKIREGDKVKIADVRFIGNDHVKPRRLRKEMDTKRWWMFSWLTGSGRFKDDQFEDDLDKLRDFYREDGYLDVEIPQEKVIFDYPTSTKLVITIQINEGRQYHIGEISMSGNKLHPEALLKLVVQQKSGMVFSPSKLDKDVESLQDFYGKDGYLDTNVHLVKKPNVGSRNIDIVYEITESEQFFVESIKIEGNTKTKSTVLLRELTLGPGEVFNLIRMKMSKQRLDNTRFFEDVNMTPETTNIPGRRNLKIAVKEARTGNLTFGAGFSSLEKAIFFTEVSQSNFDIFNRKGFFQGDGQKFRIKLQIGSYSSEATISFEEPYVFQKELALGFELFRTSSNYDNSYYDDIRTGASVYLRKRLFELVEGKITYSYEVLDVSNITSGYEIYVTPGKTHISKIGLQLLRDTRDKIINTTSGSYLEFDTDVYGGPFGGDIDLYRLEVRASQFFKIFDTQEQVLSIIGRGGVLNGYGRTTSFNRYRTEGFFLGGPYDLRGFENRDVGPHDPSGLPLGGKSYGFLSLEYTVDIVSPIRFAVFYDAGFVNEDAYDFTPSAYNDNFGFGLRLFVAGAPLSLDFGIPLTSFKNSTYTNKKGNQFNFSFGTRF